MSFYDDVTHDVGEVLGDAARAMLTNLQHATVVRADNVLEYYATQVDSGTEFNKQLARQVPPFDYLWLEFTRPPSAYRIEGEVFAWPKIGFLRAGALLETRDLGAHSDPRWHVQFMNWYEISRDILVTPDKKGYARYPLLRGEYWLDAQGEIINGIDFIEPLASMPDALRIVLSFNSQVFGDALTLAMTFLNCKNVQLDHEVPHASERTREQKRLNQWPKADHDFHTIHLTPLREVTRNAASGVSSSDAHKRLHIVRGHFRTYTDDKPLLGKPGLSGQFWIPQHTAGKAQGGISADYEIDV